ncbi:hypothetical protein [Martelella sp. FOR1707]
MSNLTRGVSAGVLAALRGGKAKNRMEDDPEEELPPEEIEGEEEPVGEDDPDPAAEEEGQEPEAEGDEEDDKMSARQARGAERRRIQAILTHPKASASADLAAHLAFSTTHSAAHAGAILNAAGKSGGGNRLADRMAGKTPKLGGGGAPSAKTEKQSLLAAVGSAMNARHRRKSNGD